MEFMGWWNAVRSALPLMDIIQSDDVIKLQTKVILVKITLLLFLKKNAENFLDDPLIGYCRWLWAPGCNGTFTGIEHSIVESWIWKVMPWYGQIIAQQVKGGDFSGCVRILFCVNECVVHVYGTAWMEGGFVTENDIPQKFDVLQYLRYWLQGLRTPIWLCIPFSWTLVNFQGRTTSRRTLTVERKISQLQTSPSPYFLNCSNKIFHVSIGISGERNDLQRLQTEPSKEFLSIKLFIYPTRLTLWLLGVHSCRILPWTDFASKKYCNNITVAYLLYDS